MNKYLDPTDIIDSEHTHIRDFLNRTLDASDDTPVKKAVKLYYAVRDGIRYDPFSPFFLPCHYRASVILEEKRGFCVSKASLLCACGRAAGIPTRIGFADVENHIAPEGLYERMGSRVFKYHAFNEFYLEGKWIKATPAFNKQLCVLCGVLPLEFNGIEDSIFQAYDVKENKFMEYLCFHDTYHDIPVDDILAAWKGEYGEKRVQSWIDQISSANLEVI